MTALPKDEYDFDAGKDQRIFRQLLDLTSEQIIHQVCMCVLKCRYHLVHL